MLQENINELRAQLLDDIVPAAEATAELEEMGFHPAMIKLALQHSLNDVDSAVAAMMKMQNDGTYESVLNDTLTLLEANNVPLAVSSEDGAVGGLNSAAQKMREELKAKTLEVRQSLFVGYFKNSFHSACLCDCRHSNVFQRIFRPTMTITWIFRWCKKKNC